MWLCPNNVYLDYPFTSDGMNSQKYVTGKVQHINDSEETIQGEEIYDNAFHFIEYSMISRSTLQMMISIVIKISSH